MAGISKMYQQSGGQNPAHKCGECGYFMQDPLDKKHFICTRQDDDSVMWKDNLMACKWFSEERNDAVMSIENSETNKNNDIVIDPEFSQLMPPLKKEEFESLEKSIREEGCRDALVVWECDGRRILVDGHNRLKICKKHNVDFKITDKHFDSRNKVKIWMIETQRGRRNWEPYIRTVMELKLEEIFAEENKKVQKEAQKSYYGNQYDKRCVSDVKDNIAETGMTQNSESYQTKEKSAALTTNEIDKERPEKSRTEKQIKRAERNARSTAAKVAKRAGVSRDTVMKVKEIEAKASPRTKELAMAGELSINQAYNSVHPKQKKADVVEQARQEHKEFEQKKAEHKVDFNDIKVDKDNQRIINKALREDVLKLFDLIGKFGMTHKTEELKNLREAVSEEDKRFIKHQCNQCHEILNIIEENL